MAHALFCEAVRAVVHRWTALNLAVSHDWGNGSAKEKREALVQETCAGFAVRKITSLGIIPKQAFQGNVVL
jgi:hypothetical protein